MAGIVYQYQMMHYLGKRMLWAFDDISLLRRKMIPLNAGTNQPTPLLFKKS